MNYKDQKGIVPLWTIALMGATVLIIAIFAVKAAQNINKNINQKPNPFDVEGQSNMPAAPAPSTGTTQGITPVADPVQELKEYVRNLKTNPPSKEDLENIYTPYVKSKCGELRGVSNFNEIELSCKEYGATEQAQAPIIPPTGETLQGRLP